MTLETETQSSNSSAKAEALRQSRKEGLIVLSVIFAFVGTAGVIHYVKNVRPQQQVQQPAAPVLSVE
jgi:hypothetical protein